MSVIHEPVCRTKGCPAPKDPDWHVPWCRDIPGHECFGDATHQHVPKRSRGGKKVVACLCAGAHDRVDNTPDWDNDITPGEDGKLEYILWDTRVEGGWNSPLICRPIDPAAGEQPNRELPLNSAVSRQVDRATPAAGSGRTQASKSGGATPRYEPPPELPKLDTKTIEEGGAEGEAGSAAAEAGAVNPDTRRGSMTDLAAAPPASGESSAAEVGKLVTPDGYVPTAQAQGNAPGEKRQSQRPQTPSDVVPVGHSEASAAPPLTHEERMGIAAEIRREQKQRQWKAGDTANAWEQEMGEECWQYLDEFGYQPETLSNIMRVCGAIPSPLRNGRLDYNHHVVVYKLNAEDQEAWLDRCESEGWKMREFRVAVHGEKPKVKRWTLEELRQEKYGTEKQRIIILAFLDWLEGKLSEFRRT